MLSDNSNILVSLYFVDMNVEFQASPMFVLTHNKGLQPFKLCALQKKHIYGGIAGVIITRNNMHYEIIPQGKRVQIGTLW